MVQAIAFVGDDPYLTLRVEGEYLVLIWNQLDKLIFGFVRFDIYGFRGRRVYPY